MYMYIYIFFLHRLLSVHNHSCTHQVCAAEPRIDFLVLNAGGERVYRCKAYINKYMYVYIYIHI